MKEKNTYTGSKVKNQFTAYLLGFIRGRRRDYLVKKIKVNTAENPMEDFAQVETGIPFEVLLETQAKQRLLMEEARGCYPRWNEMEDQRLIEALSNLCEDERHLIYQHVFEERSFKEMSLLNGLPEAKCKGIYYYAIKKIRNRMGGERS
ncbi:MAG: sigma-70 family RNA polymerase sigma factor [Eubacteriales bacterium]|nr:sigma-70 family RNA polymerase sigma factor [Eubacteriales bacterium]